jgi:hypothetical protein
MSECNGDGFCLRQGDTPNEYQLNNCPHNCRPIECPNFKICGTLLPRCITFCNKGTCMNCRLLFGKLTFYDSVECPICLEEKPGVKRINCDHNVCIDCFVRCHYGEKILQPVFPYSEQVEDEYDNNPGDNKWKEDLLIQNYIKEWKVYEEKEDEAYLREESLRVCGICRR